MYFYWRNGKWKGSLLISLSKSHSIPSIQFMPHPKCSMHGDSGYTVPE